jgi:hypothetical protein
MRNINYLQQSLVDFSEPTARGRALKALVVAGLIASALIGRLS